MDHQERAKRARLNFAVAGNMGRFSSNSILIRDAPPSHFRFKIESFSLLSSSSLERYESCEFNSGDYKWRMAIYPNGNNKGDGKDHLSIYLLLDNSHYNNLNKEISVTFNFLAYNQILDNYLSVQGVSRFHSMKYETGIDKFLPLVFFKDPSNGYLVNNTCMFGVDVFVVKTTATKGQCLSMMPLKPLPFKYTWKVENFTALEDKFYYSDMFRSGNYDWKIVFYPKGCATGSGKSISLYLHLATPLGRGIVVVAEFKLRVVNQFNDKHKEIGTTTCFRACTENQGYGWQNFMNQSLLNKSTGYLVNGACILEAEVIVLGSSKNWV